jgi:DNA-damage-inducible protein J
MATTTMVHVRMDESIKKEAAETLAAMGLTVSDAVRVFLTRVVTDQQLPFALEAPNASTRAAMREARVLGKPLCASGKDLVDEQQRSKSRKRAVPPSLPSRPKA